MFKNYLIYQQSMNLGSAGLIDTSSIDKSIFGTGKFFKEQSINEKQNNIYEDIDEAIKKAPEEEK